MQAMQDPAAEFITGETMRAACEWAPVLLAHFRSVLGDAAEPAEVKLARRLLAWVKRKGIAELSERDALDALDGNGLKMDELRPALALLVESEWLRELAPPSAQTARGTQSLATLRREPRRPRRVTTAKRFGPFCPLLHGQGYRERLCASKRWACGNGLNLCRFSCLRCWRIAASV
jgi:hypothetical protein